MEHINQKLNTLLKQLLDRLFPSQKVKKVKVTLQTVGLSGVVFLSLIASPLVGMFNSNALVALILVLFTLVYLSNRAVQGRGTELTADVRCVVRFRKRISPDCIVWLPMLFATALGFVKGSWGMGNLIDLVVIFCCVAIILDAPDTIAAYRRCMRLFVDMALFYAVSIWIQVLFPGVFDVYVSLMQNASDHLKGLSSYYTGFTTNPVHTAGYIASGIFVLAFNLPRKKPMTFVLMAFLLVSLLYTGLRMQAAAVCLCLVVFVFLYTPADKRMKLCKYLFGAGLLALLILFLFREQLSGIPLIKRLFATLEGLIKGEDVTSNRSRLYRLALELFQESPVIGIGWGNFRLAVPGVVTKRTKFDVHNIYLQLLCETGVVGFVCFCIPIVYSLVAAFREILGQLKTDANSPWVRILGFGLLYQIYFLTVGITDNTLYNIYSQIPYLIGCSGLFAYRKVKQRKIERQIRDRRRGKDCVE